MIAYDDSDGWYDHQIGPIVEHFADRCRWPDGPRPCGIVTPLLAGITGAACAGTMRLRSAPSPDGDFALRQTELRRSHRDRPDFDHPLYRRQLAQRQRSATARSMPSPTPSPSMFSFTTAEHLHRTCCWTTLLGEITQKGCAPYLTRRIAQLPGRRRNSTPRALLFIWRSTSVDKVL